MPNEQAARAGIDRLRSAAGWAARDYKHHNPGAACGSSRRETQLKDGRYDYLLFADRVAVGIVEAKRQGPTPPGVADQSEFYAVESPPCALQLR